MPVEFLLIDLSSILRPFYIVSPQDCVTQTLDRVRGLASNHPHTAVCCDGSRSQRKDLDPHYKAQRPETDAALWHSQALVCEALEQDGFPVWEQDGYEADDIIASATLAALTASADATVKIITADKDLLQLVTSRVRVQSLKNNAVLDVEAVREVYGVQPEQITDWLCLVGDTSDNVVGAKGIGPKTATKLLQQFGTLAHIYDALDHPDVPLSPPMQRSTLESLLGFRERWPLVRQLITLRQEVEVPFAELAAERTPVEQAPSDDGDVAAVPSVPNGGDSGQPPPPPPVKPADVLVTDDAPVVAPPPQEWGRQLEPRSMGEAAKLASAMHAARLFNGYGSWQGVLSTIIIGRELGLAAGASLRGLHVIEGRHSLAADAMRALVLRSGHAKYFRCIERTAERCTWETWRIGEPEPQRLTHTIEQAQHSWQKDQRAWQSSAWGRMPEDMLSARASS